IVMDACGVGALPDAADYGDAGSNTLGHVAEAAGGFDLPVMERLGLGNVLPLAGVPPVQQPVVHGRLHPLGPGKDSISGHWELMGVVTPGALRTYPDAFERTQGRKDLALPPPGRSYLQELQDAEIRVHTVGKVGQVFAGVGVDEQHPGATNEAALASTAALVDGLDEGFVFTNLVET